MMKIILCKEKRGSARKSFTVHFISSHAVSYQRLKRARSILPRADGLFVRKKGEKKTAFLFSYDVVGARTRQFPVY